MPDNRQPFEWREKAIKGIEQTLRLLEEQLLTPSVRSSAEKIDELLDDDFMEITSSGTVKTKQDCLDGLQTPEMILSQFSIRVISEGVVQTFYKIETEDRKTLRSSIWKESGEGWKMVYHQGTPAAE
nr:DUF4440 domain-containing protein [Metabacillus mangrovi]